MRSNRLQDGRQDERVEKLRILEDGQGSDRIVLQRQKLNRVSPPFGTRLRAAIHGESRLQVSGCRDETKAAIGSPGPSEEGPNCLAPAIPVAPRRHAVDGILAEELDKFIEIGTPPRLACSDRAARAADRPGRAETRAGRWEIVAGISSTGGGVLSAVNLNAQ